MLRSRDDSIAGGAATEGGAVSLFLEVCVDNNDVQVRPLSSEGLQ